MTQSASSAKIIASGFYLFAKKPTHLAVLMLPDLICDSSEQQDNVKSIVRIVRNFRSAEGVEEREEKTNVTFELFDNNFVLSDIFLTQEFGIRVISDSDSCRFELSPQTKPSWFTTDFVFKTLDGFEFEPRCNYRTI